MSMLRLDHATAGRDNNFNLLRMVAATSVLVSHAYPLALGPEAPEPLHDVLGINLGTLAVITFFAISGYFISQSFHARDSVLEFSVARVLRIYPGLAVVLVLSAFVVGPLFTTLDIATYLSHSETLLYIPRNLSLKLLQYDLPGVFDDNPYPRALNGSLWTLFYEAGCYGMVVLVALLALAPRPRRFAYFLVAYALFYATVAVLDWRYQAVAHMVMLRNAHLLVLPFVIGMAIFQFRRYLPLRPLGLGAMTAAAVLSYGRPWFHEIFVLAWSYGVFYLGFLRIGPLLRYNKLGDYSYGMYIYAFPVGQIVAALDKGRTPLTLMVWSFPPTLLLSMLSWHLLEKRALAQKSATSAWLRRVMTTKEIRQPRP